MNSLIPFMGAPESAQGGLLGTASNYGYPITSGLLGALSQPHDYTQDALALAGNPHAGPYANAPGFPAGSGSPISTGSSGSSAGSTVGGLLTALAKNPALLKDGVGAVSDLLGGGLAAYGSGAAADAATTAALGSVGAQTAGESAAIQAANDAALSGSAAGSAAAGSGAAGSGAAASGSGAASSGLLSAMGALAIPAAILAFGMSRTPVTESAAWWNDMTNRLGSSDPNTANMARLTVANDYLNGGGDMPYSQQQLASFGITPQYLADLSRPITSPAPGGKGWLGGGYTGASRA